jgi:hypothetical protein
MRRPIEEVVDEALQSLLEGESAETIAARYPEYADDLRPLLFAAGTLKRAPQPQLSQPSLAAMVARAQAQAADDRDRVPVIVPPIAVDSNAEATDIERAATPQRSARPAPAKKMSWSNRVAGWMRPSGPLLRVPGALALVLVVALGIFVVSRLVNQPQPPFIPVPTVSTQFSVDGTIEQMGSNMWVVGGTVIYLDADTSISGKASIGSSAHVEGEIASDNRRIARSIVVSPGVTSTMTAAIASVTAQSTPAAVTGWATVPPTISAQEAMTPTAKAQALPSANVARPTATGRAAGQQPTISVPTKAVPTAAPTKPAATNAIPTQAIAQPSRTEAPQPTSTTATEPEPTATSLPEPQPGPASTPTVFVPPTTEPSDTPTPTPAPRPTGEPTDTPQPTTNPNPTETPQPEDTETPRPTVAPPNTPTTLPTMPPVPSPTRSEEPHETQTAAPTEIPPPTGTTEPTRTVQLTQTIEPSQTTRPSETAQPTQTVQPTQTEHSEETHSPQPTDQPHGTETAEPTHTTG